MQQIPTREYFWLTLCLTYHCKSDGSETRQAVQDALLTACRALQPSRVTLDFEGRYSRSPNGAPTPARAHACSDAAVTHGSHAEEEAAWVRLARGAAQAMPSLRQLVEGDGLQGMWVKDAAGRSRRPMEEAFRAARVEAEA